MLQGKVSIQQVDYYKSFMASVIQPVRRFGKQSYPNVCGGPLTTWLRIKNDYQYPLSMETRTPNGWKNMGMILPADKEAFWRGSGEEWRLSDPQTGKIVDQLTTDQGNMDLYAGQSKPPLGYRYMQRHLL